MAEHLSQSELDYPFKLLEYFNGFRISKVCVLWATHTEFLNVSIKEFLSKWVHEYQSVIWYKSVLLCDVESPEASLADRFNNVYHTWYLLLDYD